MANTLPTDQEIENIINQSPDWVTAVQVSELWMEHKGDVVAILAALWKCQESVPKNQTHWDKMREVCDAHDAELEKVINKMTR